MFIFLTTPLPQAMHSFFTVSPTSRESWDSAQEYHRRLSNTPTSTTIQWERDRLILALLSIMVPEGLLVTLGVALGLSRLVIEQVMSRCSALGERVYEIFLRASMSGQPLTFGKILIGLKNSSIIGHITPILMSYVQSQPMSQSFDEADSDLSTLFITWLHTNHPTLLSQVGQLDIAKNRVISPEEQQRLFLDLSEEMSCVWRMVGRLLGLRDCDIRDIEGRTSLDGQRESCYQMLLMWVKRSRPSNVTYYRLMIVLVLISLGGSAALDAITRLISFVRRLRARR